MSDQRRTRGTNQSRPSVRQQDGRQRQTRQQGSQRTPSSRTSSQRRTTQSRQAARPYQSRQTQRRPAASQQTTPINPLIIAVAVALIVVALVFLLVVPRACGGPQSGSDQAQSAQTSQQDESAASAAAAANDGRVTLLAVGDNTPNDNVGAYADRLLGEEGDGKYDYAPIFQPVASRVQAADLAFENQETCIGGNEIGPQGYPSFNTTDEMADAVVETGFNLVGTANNHSYDWGKSGSVEHSISVWEKQPVEFAGTAANAEQYNRITTFEREGIKFALLNYTYGLNGYEAIIEPNIVHLIDEDEITADVKRAHEQADVVLVAMHWGNEHETEPSDEQREQAQMLANLDVDVVIGAHPHVIQPMEWVDNSNGSGHRTLVTYSLGNFLIDHSDPIPENVLEGMLTCDIVRADDGSIHVENIAWTPLVLHVNADQTEFTVYPVDDYTADLASKNRGLTTVDDPMNWLYDRTKEIVGKQWFTS